MLMRFFLQWPDLSAQLTHQTVLLSAQLVVNFVWLERNYESRLIYFSIDPTTRQEKTGCLLNFRALI